MTISFDLDDLLICAGDTPREPRRFGEPLRLGARELLNGLREEGHRVGIYTSSYRPAWGIRLWLRCHGVRVAFVLTQRDNDFHRIAGKRPRAFGIDLHLDDDPTVADLCLAPDDPEWVAKVWATVGDGCRQGVRVR